MGDQVSVVEECLKVVAVWQVSIKLPPPTQSHTLCQAVLLQEPLHRSSPGQGLYKSHMYIYWKMALAVQVAKPRYS